MARTDTRPTRGTLERGRPARHARGMARRAALAAAAWTGVAAVAAAATFWLLPATVVGAVAAAVAVAAALAAAARNRGVAARARAGVRSEDRVRPVLARMRPAAVVHGAVLGAGGDADHVVLGPCAAVVETKTGRGAVEVRGSAMRVGGRPVPGDPVAQARRQAAALRRRAGVWVDAVVCVVDATSPPQPVDGVWVCGLADLPRVLDRLDTRVDDDTARRVASALPLSDTDAAAEAAS